MVTRLVVLVMGVRGFLREYDGIIALNDLMAIGAILAIREIGLRIPEDIAVLEIMKRALREKEDIDMEFRILLPDG